VEVGAVIVATGYDAFDPSALTISFGFSPQPSKEQAWLIIIARVNCSLELLLNLCVSYISSSYCFIG